MNIKTNLVLEFGEYCKGVKDRGNIFNLAQVDISKASGKREIYKSLFLHDKTLKDYVEEFKTVSGFKGIHYSDTFLFDIDSSDLEKARGEAKYLYSFFRSHELKNIKIFFSGNKGFHIEVPTKVFNAQPSDHFASDMKNVAMLIKENSELTCLDLSIYESKRLIRIGNTINEKSGLHKIPLTWNELEKLPIDKIKELAKEPRVIDYSNFFECETIQSLTDIWDFAQRRYHTPPTATQEKNNDLLRPATQGERNNRLTQISGTLLKHGLDIGMVSQIALIWNQRNEQPLKDSEVRATVKGIFDRYQPATELKIYSFMDSVKAFQENISSTRGIKFLVPNLDKQLRGGMRAGEVMVIAGKTSVGKTSVALNFAINAVKEQNINGLIFSFEMDLGSLCERTYQIGEGINSNDAYNGLKEGIIHTSNQYEKLCFVTEICSIDKIQQYITHYETTYQKKLNLIMIDYIGLITAKGNNNYEKQSSIAKEMKELAKRNNISIILLSQVSKQYNTDSDIDLNSTRDSGTIIEACDFFIGLSANEDAETDSHYYLNLGLHKNRRGKVGQTTITMSKESLRIEETKLIEKPKKKKHCKNVNNDSDVF